MSLEPIKDGERANFETLREACKDDRLALIVCETQHLGARVAVVCAMNVNEDGSVSPVPLAKLFTGNPYEEIRGPTASTASNSKATVGSDWLKAKEVAMAAVHMTGWNDDTLLSLLLDFCDEHKLVGQLKEKFERVIKDESNASD